MDKSSKAYFQISQDPFARVQPADIDSSSEVFKIYEEDRSLTKFNLIPTSYNDTPNRAYKFEVSQKVQREVIEANLDKDYIHMIGDPELNKEAQKLIFGNKVTSLAEKIVTVATVSGSNSFRIIMEFFKEFVKKDVYMPSPSWENHVKILKKVGLKVKFYPCFHAKTKNFDIEGTCKILKAAPPGSIVVLNASAYNPAGVEPSVKQWETLAGIFKERGLFAVFDSPAQGLISGDINKDNVSIQTFLKEDIQVVVCQNLASSLGIYGEKVGSLHVLCKSKEISGKVLEQLKLIVRTMHSNPPCNGELIAQRILKNQAYRAQWENELKKIAEKSRQLRKFIYDELKEFGEDGQWEYLIQQEGPFCHLDFSRKQRSFLKNRYQIYVAEKGVINLEHLKIKDVVYLTEAFRNALAIPSSQF